MRIGKVIGTVTLNRAHATFESATFRLALPLSQDNLMEHSEPNSEALVVYDELGAGDGNLVMISEGAEAAQPFYPELKPVDAYNAGILDEINV